MAFWDKVASYFGYSRNFDAKSLTGWPESVFDLKIEGAPTINAKTSSTISTYFACLSIISNTFAYIPKAVRKKLPGGGSVADTEHDQYRLISKRPNQWQSAFNFWKEFEENKKNWGNGLAYIDRDRYTGRPIGYINMRPSFAKPGFSDGKLYIEYTEKLPDGRMFKSPIDYKDVIHVPNFGSAYNDELGCIWGKSQISVAKDALGIGKSSENALSSFFANGGLFDKFITTDLVLTKEQRAVLRESMKQIRGASNAGKYGIFDAGIEVKGLPMPFKDFAFLQANEFNVEEIARFFTFSALHKLGHLGKMSFNNIYQMSIEFVQTTMLPESKPIEEELAYKVLWPDEYNNSTHIINWEWKGLLQADPDKRKELLQMFWGMGVPANEILRIEDMNPIGESGDVSYVQAAYMPGELSMDYWKSLIEKSKAPSQLKPSLNGVH